MNNGWLPLTTVQVARETAPVNDGMGGVSTVTTTLSTLRRAAIFDAGNADRFVAGKVAKASTHVLVADNDYTWTGYDRFVVYNSVTYRVTGTPENTSLLGRQYVVGLELIG